MGAGSVIRGGWSWIAPRLLPSQRGLKGRHGHSRQKGHYTPGADESCSSEFGAGLVDLRGESNSSRPPAHKGHNHLNSESRPRAGGCAFLAFKTHLIVESLNASLAATWIQRVAAAGSVGLFERLCATL